MRIFLIGFMGSGKSTVGKKLAQKMGLDFIDMDAYIEKQSGKTIPYLFEHVGEEQFRKMEREALAELFEKDDAVISTGGGTPCFFDNMDRINQNGRSVYLKMDSNTLVRRLTDSKKERPLTKKLNGEELKSFIDKTLSEREKFYLRANLIVDGRSVDVNELIEKINYSR